MGRDAACVLAIVSISVLGARCGRPSPESQEKSPRGFVLPDGDAALGRQAFVDLKCHVCHEVSGLENELPRPTATPVVGVKLGGLAMREPTDGELVTSIVNPSHELYPAGEEERITSGTQSRMGTYNDIMTTRQLVDLVAFLHERYETRPEGS